MSRIYSKTSVRDVQGVMNASRGSEYWVGRSPQWRTFLSARNNFIKQQLLDLGLSPQQLTDLQVDIRLDKVSQLEQAFTTTFFEYSRGVDWMRNAVGDKDDWIRVEGMAAWHVKMALFALLTEDSHNPPDLASPISPPDGIRIVMFDPVKDAIGSKKT